MMDRGDDSAPPIVACQGVPGAFSYEACGQAEPDLYAMPCTSFEEVIIAVRERRAERAVIPIENSIFGRVADIHRLLPNSGLAAPMSMLHFRLPAAPRAGREASLRAPETDAGSLLSRHSSIDTFQAKVPGDARGGERM